MQHGVRSAFWFSDTDNFGDAVLPWLCRALHLPVPRWAKPAPGVIVAIGSIANHATPGSVVWGAGVANAADTVDPGARVIGVRGPLTARIAGGAPVIGDPAILLRRVWPQVTDRDARRRRPVGLLPHKVERDMVERVYGDQIRDGGFRFIDICQPPEVLLLDLMACRCVVSASLHGLIACDVLNIPSRWAQFSRMVLGDGTKYRDHDLAVGRAHRPPLDLRPEFGPQTDPDTLPEFNAPDLVGLDLVGRVEDTWQAPADIDALAEILWNTCPFRP